MYRLGQALFVPTRFTPTMLVLNIFLYRLFAGTEILMKVPKPKRALNARGRKPAAYKKHVSLTLLQYVAISHYCYYHYYSNWRDGVKFTFILS